MGEPWFGAKRYGIGLGPRNAAGWICVLVFVLLVVAIPLAGRYFGAPPWAMLIAMAVVVAGFIGLMFAKSDHEPWKWRWGGR